MAKWLRRAQFGPEEDFFASREKHSRRRRNRLADRTLRIEPCEERTLFAIGGGPDLIAIIPNEGSVIAAGDRVTIAPREITLRFDDGQVIDPSQSNLAAISVVRSGFDDNFNNGTTPIAIGFVGIGERPNDVIVRFATNLPDDLYQVRIAGTLQNVSGDKFNDGIASTTQFDLDLGPQVIAVVPQPVTRTPGGQLQYATDAMGRNAINQIEVFFNSDPLNAAGAINPEFYQLIHTNGTRTSLDDTIVNPISVSPPGTSHKVVLSFAPGVLTTADTFRLRIGNSEPLPALPDFRAFAIGDVTVAEGDTGTEIATFTVTRTSDLTEEVTVNFATANGAATAGSDYTATSGTLTFIAGQQTATVSVTILNDMADEPNETFFVQLSNPSKYRIFDGRGVGTIIDNEGTIDRNVPQDLDSSFDHAVDLGIVFAGNFGQSLVGNGTIEPQPYSIAWPGTNDDPGHRQIPAETHLLGVTDTDGGIPIVAYNFQDEYGFDPQGNILHNLITENQKQRAREIFTLYSKYAGIQFVETVDLGLTIVTGDMRAINPNVATGPGGIFSISGDLMSIMDSAEDWGDGEYGGIWQRQAMSSIGFLLGLGFADDLAQLTIKNDGTGGLPLIVNEDEIVLPGDHDIVHLQNLFRPDSKDVDVYKLDLSQSGTVTFEALAEQLLPSASLLDAVITVYDGSRKIIARNDNYFGKDALLELDLEAGTYYVAVSSLGNTSFDPNVTDSGLGGTTDGAYQLRLSFSPKATGGLTDAGGVLFDGDADGKPGGAYNFWFRTQTAVNTIYVDKAFTGQGQDGSITNPYKDIDLALAAAVEGDIVRIVGNNINTTTGAVDLTNALAYNIGYDILNTELSDGSRLEVPRGVTVMIDAGAIIRLRKAIVDVGTSAVGIDRSGSALQVLGTPNASVYFTSYHDELVGKDLDVRNTNPAAGDWGGLVFREDSDFEQDGIFLNYVNHADLRFGGGKVGPTPTDIIEQIVYNPVHMIAARPTVTFNKITNSADAAISGDPNSFEESVFIDTVSANAAAWFMTDYGRVGPDIYGNSLVESYRVKKTDTTASTQLNSLNGMFVRIRTDAGQTLDPLTLPARFDDTDIVHMLTENLLILGDAGGATAAKTLPELTVGDVAATEGAGSLEFEIFLRQPSLDTVTVEYTLNPGTALPDSDYTAASGSLTFLPGQTSQFVVAALVDDMTDEDNKTFSIALSSPVNATLGTSVATGTIIDDDSPTITAWIDDDVSFEGGFAFLTVTLSKAPTRDLTLIYTTSDGTALAGDGDYAPTTGSLTFLADSLFNSKFIFISLPDDAALEEDESFFITVSLPPDALDTSVTFERPVGKVTIISNEPSTTDVTFESRLNARLAIDPGIVTKLGGARIEVQSGAQLLTEGTAANPTILTSLADDSYGRGGTFDTTRDGTTSTPGPGDWAGIYFAAASSGSIDRAYLGYGGGRSAIEGNFANFNVIEILQSDVRVANSTIENNANGDDAEIDTLQGTARNGRLTNESATIFVRGAQPRLLNNVIRKNLGAVVNINVNSLNPLLVDDSGRSTGPIDLVGSFITNHGPLVSGNRANDNETNAMVVRGGTLTTQSIWDDTNIVHVLLDGVVSGNFHTSGGVRLLSKPGSSLVVKLDGADAGFTAEGTPLDIDDRIGGMVQIVGQPDAPVVLTALADDTVGAGFETDGTPQTDTNNDGGASAPTAGDWRGILLDHFSNDRNVEIVTEVEQTFPGTGDTNNLAATAQFLGNLAKNQKSGDDNLRLGFEVQGSLNRTVFQGQADVDVYSFRGTAGTMVFLDIDRTSFSLDTVVDLINASNAPTASSNDSELELAYGNLLTGTSAVASLGANGRILQQSETQLRDLYTLNSKDAGMRVVLPGTVGTTSTYYVRVRSNSANLNDLEKGETAGSYQLQIRLGNPDELPGSSVRYADIRYATNGIEIIGKPEHSPLLGESTESTADNTTTAGAQNLGNLLTADRGTLGVAGTLSGAADVDFYQFNLEYDLVHQIAGTIASGQNWTTLFDIDYADGMGRGDLTLSVFDANGNLILVSRDSDVQDDQPRPGQGADTSNLPGGTFGKLDPFIGAVQLPEGGARTYFVAITSTTRLPEVLNATFQAGATQPLVRLEPINSLQRIVEHHVGEDGGSTSSDPRFLLELTPLQYHLGDVALFVNTAGGKLHTVDPFTGSAEVDITEAGTMLSFGGPISYGDVAMRNDGRLVSFSRGNTDGNSGNYQQIDTGTGAQTGINSDDAIITYQLDLDNPFDADGNPVFVVQDVGLQFEAFTFVQSGAEGRRLFAIGNRAPGNMVVETNNILVELNPDTGEPVTLWPDPPGLADPGNTMFINSVAAALKTAPTIVAVSATDVINPFNTPGDILDGQTLTVNGTVFEFNTGPTARVNNVVITDGETFMVDGVVFEFDQGEIIDVSPASAFADGQTFTVTDSNSVTRTFEFDLLPTNGVAGGNIAIPFNGSDSAPQMAARLVAAINNSGLTTVATAPGGGSRITLIDDDNVDALLAPGMVVSGQGTAAGNIPVPYEESNSVTTNGQAIATAVNANIATVTAKFARDRLTFLDATSFTSAIPVLTSTGGDSTITAPQIGIPIDADLTAAQVATLIATAINDNLNPPVVATAQGGTVEAIGATAITSTSPITAAGVGGGGNITGLAAIAGTLYAVSENGGLFSIDAPGSAAAALVPIANLMDADGAPIVFSGLSAGPLNVEESAYAETLFATDVSGVIYAFDTAGNLLPVFLDSQISIDTGISGLQGLAFTTLDYTLWHQTTRRMDNAGHGINVSFDNDAARNPPINGGASYYFGFEDPAAGTIPMTEVPQAQSNAYATNPGVYNTYDLPGGAHGSLISNSFSLEGYSPTDKPTLYFNYFLASEDRNSPTTDPATMRDSMRVFVSLDGGGAWTQITANNSTLSTQEVKMELGTSKTASGGTYRNDRSDQLMQELYDNSGGWRQARIDLGDFVLPGVDASRMRLRFDFSTAGTMNTGDALTTGDVLRALPGIDIADGDTFILDDTNGGTGMQLFEFDKGFSLAAPAGAGTTLVEGETFTITGPGGSATFEFDRNGAVSGTNVRIAILASDSAEEIALRIVDALAASTLGVTPHFKANRVDLQDATVVTLSASAKMMILGDAPGMLSNPGAIPVVINGGLTAGRVIVDLIPIDGVATQMADAIDATYSAANDPAIYTSLKLDGEVLKLIGRAVFFAGPLPFATGVPALPDPDTLEDLSALAADGFGNFYNRTRHQSNNFEGVYIDDIIIGFAERGEMVTGVTPNSNFFTNSITGNPITGGAYQLEIRRGTEYALVGVDNKTLLFNSFDTNDRLGSGVTLKLPDGTGLQENGAFVLSDGVASARFAFDSDSSALPTGTIRIAYASNDTAEMLATRLVSAINALTTIKVKAVARNHSGIVDLYGALAVDLSTVPEIKQLAAENVILPDLNPAGDTNLTRDQGYTIIQGSSITHSSQFAINVEAAPRGVGDSLPRAGSPISTPTVNTARLVSGVAITNNVIAFSGQGGISLNGDADVDPAAAVLFARIINNTVYGNTGAQGVGLDINTNSSPTVLNNIFANLLTAVDVDGTSGNSVFGANVYQGNGVNGNGAGTFDFNLAAGLPLFVDAAAGNFYLATGSRAIDSSVNSLVDRFEVTNVTNPLGISASPMVAPDFDQHGQLRVDDPAAQSPPGQGLNVFKDRGAIERSDFVGPEAVLISPQDNDGGGIDGDPDVTEVSLLGQRTSAFSFRYDDATGSGIDDATVNRTSVTLKRDGQVLTESIDYIYDYNTTTNSVVLQSVAGLFVDGVYTIEIGNSNTDARDIAGNSVRPNQTDGATMFTITIEISPIFAWQNPLNNLDVSGDGFVSPVDVLLIIDRLNRFSIGPLPLPATPPPFYDVNGDGLSSPADALLVIDFLNRQSSGFLSSFESSDHQPSASAGLPPVVAFAASSSTSDASLDVAFGLSVQSTPASSASSMVSTSSVPAVEPVHAAIDSVLATMADDDRELSLYGAPIDELTAGSSDFEIDDSLFDAIDAILLRRPGLVRG